MVDIYGLSNFMVRLFGPMMLVCFILMYIFAAGYQGRRLSPREVIAVYVRHNVSKNRHAGFLTYLFLVSFIFFVLASLGLLLGKPPA